MITLNSGALATDQAPRQAEPRHLLCHRLLEPPQHVNNSTDHRRRYPSARSRRATPNSSRFRAENRRLLPAPRRPGDPAGPHPSHRDRSAGAEAHRSNRAASVSVHSALLDTMIIVIVYYCRTPCQYLSQQGPASRGRNEVGSLGLPCHASKANPALAHRNSFREVTCTLRDRNFLSFSASLARG